MKVAEVVRTARTLTTCAVVLLDSVLQSGLGLSEYFPVVRCICSSGRGGNVSLLAVGEGPPVPRPLPEQLALGDICGKDEERNKLVCCHVPQLAPSLQQALRRANHMRFEACPIRQKTLRQ